METGVREERLLSSALIRPSLQSLTLCQISDVLCNLNRSGL